MGKLVLDSCEYEVPQEVINAVSKMRTDAVTATAQINTLTVERDTLKGGNDSLKVKLDAFEKRDFSKEVTAAVAARRNLEVSAAKVLPKETKFDSLSDVEIRTAVIAKALPTIKLDGQSEAYIDGCFNAAIVASETGLRADAAALNRTLSTELPACDTRNDSKKKVSSESSMESYKRRTTDAWKGKEKKESDDGSGK